MTSRRVVLGSVLGGTAAAALPGVAEAASAQVPDAVGEDLTAGSTGGRWKLRNRMGSDGAWTDFLRRQD
ncbi:hypothetical protein ACWD4T_21870, partial [Streptomyces umbrinus]